MTFADAFADDRQSHENDWQSVELAAATARRVSDMLGVGELSQGRSRAAGRPVAVALQCVEWNFRILSELRLQPAQSPTRPEARPGGLGAGRFQPQLRQDTKIPLYTLKRDRHGPPGRTSGLG